MSKDNKEKTEKELTKEVVKIVLNEILVKYDQKTNNKGSK